MSQAFEPFCSLSDFSHLLDDVTEVREGADLQQG